MALIEALAADGTLALFQDSLGPVLGSLQDAGLLDDVMTTVDGLLASGAVDGVTTLLEGLLSAGMGAEES